jgi:hypothetical protein
MRRQNPNQGRKNSSETKKQFSVRLSPERARVIRTHLNLYDDATAADALRAAVDALGRRHTTPGADARRLSTDDGDTTRKFSMDP